MFTPANMVSKAVDSPGSCVIPEVYGDMRAIFNRVDFVDPESCECKLSCPQPSICPSAEPISIQNQRGLGEMA